MDYQKVYASLISKRIICPLKKSKDLYTEVHHIVPKCLGGSNDPENLTRLTAKEHFVAHRLLAKIHDSNVDLAQAILLMASSGDLPFVNSRGFEILKTNVSRSKSLNMKQKWKEENFRTKMSASSKLAQNTPSQLETHRLNKTKWWNANESKKDEFSQRMKETMETLNRNNPYPWQRNRARPTKHIWTFAATFWELSKFNLENKETAVGYEAFSSLFTRGKYRNIFQSMEMMFKRGWVPLDCPAWKEDFGFKC